MSSLRSVKTVSPYFCGLALLYIIYWQLFKKGLSVDYWLSYGIFAKYLVPDVFLYKQISESGSSIFLNILAVKNSGYSVLLWTIFEDWFTVYLFNFILVLLTIKRWVVFTGRKLSWFEILIFVNPLWCYYSLGPTKEIPLLFLITLLITSRHVSWKVNLLLLAITLIRLHLGALFCFIAVLVKYPKLRVTGVVVILTIFPLISEVFANFRGSEMEYRDNIEGLGIGSFIEYLKNDVILLSLPAIIFRAVQLVTEPFLSFIKNFGFYQNKISVIHWLEFYTFIIIMIKVFTSKTLTLVFLWRSELGSLLLMISAFSFLHWRYVLILIPFLVFYAAREKSYS